MALNIYISLTVTVGWRASRFTKERERESQSNGWGHFHSWGNVKMEERDKNRQSRSVLTVKTHRG